MNTCDAVKNKKTSPLTPGRKALWYTHKISPDNCAYNINLAWRIKGNPDTEFFKNAVEAVMERHSVMKTTYRINKDGEIFQHFNPDIPLEFEEIDCQGWSETNLKDVLREESYRAFDLENGPISRWTLFSQTESDHILFFSIHHIATDYPGLIMMFTDLSLFLKKGKICDLQLDDRSDYTEFFEYLESRTKGIRGKKLADYWKKQLKASLTPLNLPLDKTRPKVPNFRGRQITAAVPKSLFERIVQFTKATGISKYTFFMSAFAILLHRYTAQDSILIASPVSCRSSKFKHLSGYCVNPVVLKADLSGNPTASDFLTRMNRQVFAALCYKDYPFITLSNTLQPKRDPGFPPIAQVMYNHVDFQRFQKKDNPLVNLTDDGTIQWQMGNSVWEQVNLRGQNDEFDLIQVSADSQIDGLIVNKDEEHMFKNLMHLIFNR